MKCYVGKRFKDRVEVHVEHNGKRYPLPQRLEIRNHSPTGFNWGYYGSGPAQLALAILADFLGPCPPPAQCPYCEGPMDAWQCCNAEDCGYQQKEEDRWSHIQRRPQHYQDFKREVIGRLSGDQFKLTDRKLRNWISQPLEDSCHATPKPKDEQ